MFVYVLFFLIVYGMCLLLRGWFSLLFVCFKRNFRFDVEMCINAALHSEGCYLVRGVSKMSRWRYMYIYIYMYIFFRSPCAKLNFQ